MLLRYTEDFENGAVMLVHSEDSSTLKRIRIAEGPEGEEEVSICWEDGSGQAVRLRGEGYEVQGILVAMERTGERAEAGGEGGSRRAGAEPGVISGKP